MAQPKKPGDMQQFHPKGTVIVLILFMIILIALWTSVYLILLSRGVNVL